MGIENIELDEQLLEDRILIKPFPVEEKDANGFLTPAENLLKPSIGLVVGVGQRYQAPQTGEWIELYIEKGYVVSFDKYAAIPYGDLLLLRQGNCISIKSK